MTRHAAMSLNARTLITAALAAAALGALPASATAESVTFGSDLAPPATIVETHGPDTAFWNPPGSSGQLVAPQGGEVTLIKLKGGMLKNSNPAVQHYERIASLFHYQVIRPQPDGSMKVVLSSGHMYLPVTSDPNVVTSYGTEANPNGSEPLLNICMQKGDILDFNTVGGHEYRRIPYDVNYQGAEIHVFGAHQGAQVRWYEKGDGTNIGQTFPFNEIQTSRERELLVQPTMDTGPDATDLCPGGYEQHVFRGLEIQPKSQDGILRTRTREVKVRVFCHGENYGGCHGNLTLKADLDGQRVELGTASFHVPGSYTVNVTLSLLPEHVRAIQRAKSVVASIEADAHDDPENDPRVKWGDAIPVQHKTKTGEITIKPDKLLPLCMVPQVKGKKLAAAKKSLAKAGCPVGRVRTAKGRKRGYVINQSPNKGSALDAGTKVSLVIAR
jgi:PASTA domain-containing protein